MRQRKNRIMLVWLMLGLLLCGCEGKVGPVVTKPLPVENIVVPSENVETSPVATVKVTEPDEITIPVETLESMEPTEATESPETVETTEPTETTGAMSDTVPEEKTEEVLDPNELEPDR